MGIPHNSVDRELRELLKSHRMRVTTVRMAVLKTLHAHESPMTHEQIMESLADGVYDKASVWRLLSELAEKGLLRRMDLGDRVWRYELQDACRTVTDDHPHFLCESCSEVTCLPPLEVRARDGGLPKALLGADFHIRISGNCKNCAAT